MRRLTVTQVISRALPPPQRASTDDVDGPVALGILTAAGLGGAVRDKQCGDLSRGQVLRVVLCVGVARAIPARRVVGTCDDRESTQQPECELYAMCAFLLYVCPIAMQGRVIGCKLV